jgi:hypothetical protein
VIQQDGAIACSYCSYTFLHLTFCRGQTFCCLHRAVFSTSFKKNAHSQPLISNRGDAYIRKYDYLLRGGGLLADAFREEIFTYKKEENKRKYEGKKQEKRKIESRTIKKNN